MHVPLGPRSSPESVPTGLVPGLHVFTHLSHKVLRLLLLATPLLEDLDFPSRAVDVRVLYAANWQKSEHAIHSRVRNMGEIP